MARLLFGIGINDANYSVSSVVDGKTVYCKIYQKWKNMLYRCFGDRSRNPSYHGCTVSDEWLSFSAFRKWVISHDGESLCLDKDLLFPGNKRYSSETCLMVTPKVNSFLTDCASSRGCYLIGVSVRKGSTKYTAQCRNPFTKKVEHLGFFNAEVDAHLAWKARKHELACMLAKNCSNDVAKAIVKKYA